MMSTEHGPLIYLAFVLSFWPVWTVLAYITLSVIQHYKGNFF